MNRLTTTLAVLLLTAATMTAQPMRFGQGTKTINLWPDGNPEKEYVARPSDFQKRVLPEGYMTPKLEVYQAKNPNGICILECPGGGYTMLSDSHEGRQMADWFNALGITYCVLEYRMPFGFDQVPLHDAERAMQIIRQHADEWGAKTIGVMGCSAGGHLASTLATHYTSDATRPDFQILLYPVITMDRNYTHMGSFENLLGTNPSQELIDKYSNEKQVNAQTPPVILILSADDNTVNPKNAIEYYYALRSAGVSASLHIYPIGGHGYGNLENFTYKRQWTAEVEKWLMQCYK
ncbi:MAG: alpha/beta hydrolase [Bacteroidaceae bacterium]|nr:alpha/beta hydrolase [Bacteroidaceae bacterium]